MKRGHDEINVELLSRKFQGRVGEPVVDAEGEGAEGVDFEAGFACAMDQYGGVVDAGHGEHAGFEGGGMEIEGNAFAENITGWCAFNEDAGTAVGQRCEDGDAVQLHCDAVILRAYDPELVFLGAHERAAFGLQRRSDFRWEFASDGAYGLCGAGNLQQGKAAGFAYLQDGACIGPGADEGGAAVKH